VAAMPFSSGSQAYIYQTPMEEDSAKELWGEIEIQDDSMKDEIVEEKIKDTASQIAKLNIY
jgi:hypothetical protein